MALYKTIDGVRYVYSEYLEKMIPLYLYDRDDLDECHVYKWNESDLLYYNQCESYCDYEYGILSYDLIRDMNIVNQDIEDIRKDIIRVNRQIDLFSKSDDTAGLWLIACNRLNFLEAQLDELTDELSQHTNIVLW